jgi:hypothetical protein
MPKCDIIYVPYNIYMGQDSVVGIVIRYGLEDSGFKHRWGQEIFSFPHASIPALGPVRPHLQWGALGAFAGIKQLGRGFDH